MKKLVMMALGGAAVLAIFANCGRNDNNPGGPTGMSASCYYQQTSANGGAYAYGYMNQPGTPCNYNYSALSSQGFSQANTAGFYQTSMMYGMCSGGAQAPVYSPSKGLGCVDATRLNLSGQVATYALSQATMAFVPNSAPSPYYQTQPYGYNNGYGGGMSGYPGTYGNGMNGMVTVLRVCDGVELCPSGQYCRSPIGPTASSAGVGICYF